MKIKTEVLLPSNDELPNDDNEKSLEAEVDSGVITFYLDGKEIFSMDFEGNFDEFIIAIMKVWGNWSQSNHKDSKENKQP